MALLDPGHDGKTGSSCPRLYHPRVTAHTAPPCSLWPEMPQPAATMKLGPLLVRSQPGDQQPQQVPPGEYAFLPPAQLGAGNTPVAQLSMVLLGLALGDGWCCPEGKLKRSSQPGCICGCPGSQTRVPSSRDHRASWHGLERSAIPHTSS